MNGDMALIDAEKISAIPECSYDPNENTLARFAHFTLLAGISDWSTLVDEDQQWNMTDSDTAIAIALA